MSCVKILANGNTMYKSTGLRNGDDDINHGVFERLQVSRSSAPRVNMITQLKILSNCMEIY